MAKNNITQFDATDANNTDIKSIDISEGMAPSNVNNALRALMATLADLNAGTTTLTAPSGVNITATTAIKTPAIQFTDGDAAITIADGGGVTANNFSSTSVNIDGGAIDGITLGTNSAVTQAVIDNINIDGTTIGHTSDTDLLTLTSGLLTVAGEVSMTTLDIGGTNVTATATELNIMDGVTATTSELNIMDGVTSTTTEINLLDGVTSTTTELNITDGSTSVGTTAVAGADGIVTNDSGTMRHTSVDTFDTYLAATSKTLTNKTIDADNNTVSNLEVDNLKSGVLDTDLSSVSSSHDTIPSAKATKDFIETSATASATSASASATSATASQTAQAAAETAQAAAASSASAASTSESNSQTSANSAAASALLAAGAFDSFDDKYLGTMADNDTASSVSMTGTFSSGATQITVAPLTSPSGLEVGQLITGTNIATGTNVIKIDGTTINISEPTTGAGSGTSLTFTGHGVFGNFNSSIDGPATTNDNTTLATGMLYFNTTDGEMRVYDGANWIAASASGSASFTKYKYVATASQTTFSGSDANSATLSYVIGNIIVALNGVILDATDFTANSGTSVVLGSGAAASDELTIYAFKSFTVADAVQASTGGTFGGNVVFNGTTTGLDLNGTELILDADGDTSITADTDDQIDFKTGGSDRLTIDSSGNVGIGTTSPDRVLHIKTADNIIGLIESTDADAWLSFQDNTSSSNNAVRVGATGDNLRFYAGSAERMRIDSSGNVGIGLTSLSYSVSSTQLSVGNTSSNGGINIVSGTSSSGILRFADGTSGDTAYRGRVEYDHSDDSLMFGTGGSERMRIDSSGRVSIGTTSPQTGLHVEASDGSVNGTIRLTATGVASAGMAMDANGLNFGADTGGFLFKTGATANDPSDTGTERMRIDSSGNLLVATTDANPGNNSGGSDVGVVLDINGKVLATTNNAEVMVLNRQNGDGDIAEFREDGSPVGSIGAVSSRLYIGTSDSTIRFKYGAGDAVVPADGSGALRDNSMDIGASASRWDDIFATNSTIQTSDQNEKQDIASATEKELNVAKKLSALFKTFRWKDKVAEKGDKARTHTGIVAQEVQSAFKAEGLDASSYGLFTSDTWWEKEISVDSVEADEEKGIEAKDAYTYMDTKQEKTDGYTEKTRLGVRYPELFSFIFSSIEARLTALEAK